MAAKETEMLAEQIDKVCLEKHKPIDQRFEAHEQWLEKLDNRIWYIVTASALQLIAVMGVLILQLIRR